MKFLLEIINCQSRKCFWKCHLETSTIFSRPQCINNSIVRYGHHGYLRDFKLMCNWHQDTTLLAASRNMCVEWEYIQCIYSLIYSIHEQACTIVWSCCEFPHLYYNMPYAWLYSSFATELVARVLKKLSLDWNSTQQSIQYYSRAN